MTTETQYPQIEKAFNQCKKQMHSDYRYFCQSVIDLCSAIESTETDETVWHLGEFEEFCLSDFIAGAYWHFTEWHDGQYSLSYRALSALGDIFSPGMSTLDDDLPERFVYDELNRLAELCQ